MATTVVLTAIGRDRVGIVAELTGLLFEMGCNLLDSSMTLLRGEFAIILMVSLPENKSKEAFEKRLKDFEAQTSLTIHVKELANEELVDMPQTGSPYIVSVYGADKAGIVSGITHALSELELNITDVETKRIGEGAESIFVMILEVMVPPSLQESKLRSHLTSVSKHLEVDISIRPLEVYEL